MNVLRYVVAVQLCFILAEGVSRYSKAAEPSLDSNIQQRSEEFIYHPSPEELIVEGDERSIKKSKENGCDSKKGKTDKNSSNVH